MKTTKTKAGHATETPIATEMKEIAATLLGVSGSDWRTAVRDAAPPWLPGSMDDERFKEMPAAMQLRIRAADLIGLVLIGEAEFLDTCGDDLEELRALAAKAGARRRAA